MTNDHRAEMASKRVKSIDQNSGKLFLTFLSPLFSLTYQILSGIQLGNLTLLISHHI